jgi:ATP-dependent Clp protease ATP-binding subunit ClpC
VVDFKNTVIIMTSNIGSNVLTHPLGFTSDTDAADAERTEKRLLDELRKAFRPEFLNRVDEIIVFRSLTREQLGQIVDLLLTKVRTLVEGQGMHLEVTEAAKALVAEQGYDQQYGARPLRRAIQRLIENPLSSELLRGTFKEGDTIVVDARDGRIVFTAEAKVAAAGA